MEHWPKMGHIHKFISVHSPHLADLDFQTGANKNKRERRFLYQDSKVKYQRYKSQETANKYEVLHYNLPIFDFNESH